MSISWTLNKTYLKKFESARLIYEYIDELEIFSLYGPEMEEDHLKLVERADVVVSTAQRLYEQVKDLSDKAILSTNGGDYEFFVRTDSYEIDPLIRDRIQGYDCVVGYYGALASWFDYDMIKTVADARPNWAFVLVGFDYDKTLQVSGVLSKKNVIYVPAQPYEKLPGFLKAFDVATVPFLINNITLSTSPVKIFEYMAAKKPIITSAMPECLKYESAAIYYSAEEFIAAVEKYAAMTPEDPYWAVLEKEALENTWDAKTDEILARIQ